MTLSLQIALLVREGIKTYEGEVWKIIWGIYWDNLTIQECWLHYISPVDSKNFNIYTLKNNQT